MRGKGGDGSGTISGRWGWGLSSVTAGRLLGRLRTLRRARWRGEDAGRDTRGPAVASLRGCWVSGRQVVRLGVESLAAVPGRC